MKRINIVGPYPPPIGGISIHIKRMKAYLEKKGIQCDIYNESNLQEIDKRIFKIRNFKTFLLLVPFLKGDIVHFHTINIRIRILLGLYKILGKKVVLTIHGQSLSDQIKSSNIISKILLIKSLKSIDRIICVNENNLKELLALNFSKEKVVTLPAYINPIENAEDYFQLPIKVRKFIEKDVFLISSNGCVRFYNNEDLYGIDFLIEIVKDLKHDGYIANLFFAVLDIKGQDEEERKYYQKLLDKVVEYGIETQVLFYEVKNTEFYPIAKRSNLFIRPTNVDGYGVSIAEALYYGVPAIASNVCKRPDGTIIFKSRDYKDLYNKVVMVLNNYDKHKFDAEHTPVSDNGEKLLEIYFEL